MGEIRNAGLLGRPHNSANIYCKY